MAVPTCGYVGSVDEANSIIQSLETATVTKYVSQRSRNLAQDRVTNIRSFRVLWELVIKRSSANPEEGSRNDQGPSIPFDGTPFVVLGTQVKECQHGPERSTRKRIENQTADHLYAGKRGRFRAQHTKKQGCSARIFMRKIIKFPQYKMCGPDTQWRRRLLSEELKREFCGESHQEMRVYMSALPLIEDHQIHPVGNIADTCQPIDTRLVEEIQKQVTDGVRKVPEMKRLLNLYATRELLPGNENVSKTNTRFFPVNTTIRNHIYQSLVSCRFSADDQTNLQDQVTRWRRERQDEMFYFRPISEDHTDGDTVEASSFLFLHQTKWQSRMLLKYGQEICLMDATYHTSKYDLPLFFLCVPTNSGFNIVASFMTGKETRENIKEALGILSVWNQEWKPKFFMCDCDHREIWALESTFKDSMVYLCDFHRIQAWERWLKDSKHGLNHRREEIMSKLRKVSGATTEEEYEQSVQDLKQQSFYLENTQFRSWIDRQWLSQYKRWVFAFRKDMFNIRVNTTNGLERQHGVFKNSYLKNYSEGSLTSMVQTLVEKFLPEAKQKYIHYNVSSLSQYKKYNVELPTFLHNRPKKFVEHCVKRLPPHVVEINESNLKRIDADTAYVQSVESAHAYVISYGDLMPNCSCMDFKKNHFPCKHMIAIFKHFPDMGWDFLPQNYREFSMFNLDTEVISDDHVDYQPPVQHEVEGMSICSSDAERSTCLDILKDIQNGLYVIDSVDHLKTIKLMLEKVLQEASVPPAVGTLPIRNQTGRRQKKKNPVVTSSIGNFQEVEMDGVYEIPTEISRPNISIQTPVLEGLNDTAKNELHKIWEREQSYDFLLAKMESINLTDTSLLYAKTNLPDEVIDAYMHILASQSMHVYHLKVITMAIILGLIEEEESCLSQVNLYDYEIIIGACNEGGNHWTLLIILPKTMTLLYFNPLGELHITEQMLLQNWYSFLRRRKNCGFGNIGSWSLHSPKHAKQTDGVSCGVYVLKIAEHFLFEKDLVFTMSRDELSQYRLHICYTILAYSEPIERRCRCCFREIVDVLEQITCANCKRNFHSDCLKLDPYPAEFKCKICSRDIRRFYEVPIKLRKPRITKRAEKDLIQEIDEPVMEISGEMKKMLVSSLDIKEMALMDIVTAMIDIDNIEELQVNDHLVQLFEKSVLSDVEKILMINDGTSFTSPYKKGWRHCVYIKEKNLSKQHHRINKASQGEKAREDLFTKNGIQTLHMLCLKHLCVYKQKTEWQYPYRGGQFMSLKKASQNLLQLFEDSVGQTMGYCEHYVMEVLFPEIEILCGAAMMQTTYQKSAAFLYPDPWVIGNKD